MTSAKMDGCLAPAISSNFDGRSAPPAQPVTATNLLGMEIDFCAFLGDPACADENHGWWQNMVVHRHEGAQWLITGRAKGRREDADAIGAVLARIWQEHLSYRHGERHTIETAQDHITLRAVTQISPGGLWVTAPPGGSSLAPRICCDQRRGPSQVSRRTSVGHQPTEDTAARSRAR